MIPVVLGLSFIIFTIMSLTPGNPASIILGEGASIQDIEALQDEMGLNDPLVVQYGRYMKNFVRGDFGTSYISKLSVTNEIKQRFPTTLKLAMGSIFIMVIIGVPIGIISAVKQYSLVDNVSLFLAMLLSSMPAFFFGLLAMLLFSLKLGWLPAMGSDTWKHFVLPCFTLVGVFLARLVRMTRSNMLEVIRADYIKTARAKGASEMSVIFKHALKNALLPIVTIIGLNFAAMLGGSVITESIFGLPGLGTMTVSGIRMKDTPTVMASILFVAIMISVVNLLVDIIYMVVDPRLRSEISK